MHNTLSVGLYPYGAPRADFERLAHALSAQASLSTQVGESLTDSDALPLARGSGHPPLRLAVVGQPTPERLSRVMASGFCGCCEADCGVEMLESLIKFLPPPPTQGFFLCLSTLAVYQLHLAQLLVETTRARAGGGKQDWNMIETGLQEAVSNAVIHGNLGIDSHMRGDVEGFEQYCRLIQERLDNPVFARRLITVRVWLETGDIFGIEIRDQGAGFSPENHTRQEEGPEHGDAVAHGRGLSIIRSCAESIVHFDGGRGVRMTFALDETRERKPGVASAQDQESQFPNQGNGLAPGREFNLTALKTPILVVDDEFVSRELIVSYLSAAGFTSIHTAENGREALEKVAEIKPGLLVLDIVMPEMDGLEVCRRLRNDGEHRGLPILVQTAQDKPEDRRRVFAAGATDLVFKPIHVEELVARIRIHIDNMLLVRGMRRYQDRVAHELSFARRMQLDMLPGQKSLDAIHEQYGVRVSSHFEPSSELGGDFWGALRVNKSMIGVYIVDFTGHGVMSALNTVRLHTMVQEIPLALSEPVAFVEEMNARLTALLPVGQFATIIYGTLDVKSSMFSYAAAAAPSPISGVPQAPIELHDGGGMPLGISRNATYVKRTISVPPGGFVLLYSDALTESNDEAGTMFGEERLLSLVRQSRDTAPPESFLDTLVAGFKRSVVTPLDDDLTVVCLMRDPA